LRKKIVNTHLKTAANAVNKNVKHSVTESCKYHILLGMRTFARFLPIALPFLLSY